MSAPEIPPLAPPPPARQRLARVRRISGAVTWYLEGDHLLVADQKLFTMRYRRLYLSDLKSVTIWPTRWHYARMAAEAAVGLLAAAVAARLRSPRAVEGIAVLLAAALGIEMWLGPRADARVETVHSAWRAPLVARWRGADAMLARLAALVPQAVERGGAASEAEAGASDPPEASEAPTASAPPEAVAP